MRPTIRPMRFRWPPCRGPANDKRHAEAWRDRLHHRVKYRIGRCVGIVESSRFASNDRCGLFQKLQPFAGDGGAETDKSGEVARWTGMARHDAIRDRIGEAGENDRNGAGRLLERPRGRRIRRQNEIGIERDQFFRIVARASGIARAPPDFISDVAAFLPAEFAKAELERRDPILTDLVVGDPHQDCHALHRIGSPRDAAISRNAAADSPVPMRNSRRLIRSPRRRGRASFAARSDRVLSRS